MFQQNGFCINCEKIKFRGLHVRWNRVCVSLQPKIVGSKLFNSGKINWINDQKWFGARKRTICWKTSLEAINQQEETKCRREVLIIIPTADFSLRKAFKRLNHKKQTPSGTPNQMITHQLVYAVVYYYMWEMSFCYCLLCSGVKPGLV